MFVSVKLNDTQMSDVSRVGLDLAEIYELIQLHILHL